MKIEKFTTEAAEISVLNFVLSGDYLLAKYTKNATHVDLPSAFI